MKSLKYIFPLLAFAGACRSFTHTGIIVWLPIFVSFAFIPLFELFFRPDEGNFSTEEEAKATANPFFDIMLYMIVPLQFATLYLFLDSMRQPYLSAADIAGRVTVMGLLCGIFGINVAHELGHRSNKGERFLAKSLLLSSLYMHFIIDHNKGHHKQVGTPQDPTTARYNEPLYIFWLRSVTGAYKRAWRIANNDTAKRGGSFIKNEMLHYQIIQLAFCGIIGFVFGDVVLGYFIMAAVIGVLLLETVNYIEHYGLMRQPLSDTAYERAMPQHSWNSNHVIGRTMLFELSRHSDHHFMASRKYQVLRHHEDAPQLPTGYPGSMLLAMVPPLWFKVMNRKIEVNSKANIQNSKSEAHSSYPS